jgi:hypothetical protein
MQKFDLYSESCLMYFQLSMSKVCFFGINLFLCKFQRTDSHGPSNRWIQCSNKSRGASFFFKKRLGANFATRHQGSQIYVGTAYQNGKNIPNNHEIYQTAIKYTKRAHNIPNGNKCTYHGHKINQHLPLQDPPKFT